MGKLKFIVLGVIILITLVGGFFIFIGAGDEIGGMNNFDGKIKEFNIVANQFSFEPSVIEVEEGDLVRIRIKSVDVAHSIAIPDFGINEGLNPGEDIEFEFVADKVGEFNFFCMVYCGEGHGDMGGKLIVR